MAILTVTQLNRHVRTYLETEMGEVSVAGELSNLSKPASGHFYFTLKDVGAQIRCVFFRNRHTLDSRGVQNGQQVVATGQLSLYEARGDYQLIVDQLVDAGLGDLYRQFELLKTKLAEKGLFDVARKKQLPRIPECIGVITSSSGAALQDILTTLARRFPLIPVIIYASDVQGKQAAPQLVQAVLRANQEQRCDVLILARGGGSIEDLWAFNDESLAYAIAGSLIPIVSGVGHETDITIADFVADRRAATPTAAAESVVPDWRDLIVQLQTIQANLKRVVLYYIHHQRLLLKHEIAKIASPGRLINSHWQTLDYLQRQLLRLQNQLVLQKQHQLRLAMTRLQARNPVLLFQQAGMHLQALNGRLIQAIGMKVNRLKQTFLHQLATLDAVSPIATMYRGYAIVRLNQHIVLDSQQLQLGDQLDIRLARGEIVCEVIDLCLKN